MLLRRWGEPEDFGGIAVYLASDASRLHTGDSFLIDGGYRDLLTQRHGLCTGAAAAPCFRQQDPEGTP